MRRFSSYGPINAKLHYYAQRHELIKRASSQLLGEIPDKKALEQSARYGKQLMLKEIYLLEFVPAIDKENREKYERDYHDKETGVTVIPVFINTGN
ncbi:MAG: hypothetical protein GY757_24085 [bacterium]|nr:hypothetical protein [bacterium]